MAMEQLQLVLQVFITLVLLGFLTLLIHLYKVIISKPEKLRAKLRIQGIRGPKPLFFYGNISDIKKIQSSVMVKELNSEHGFSHDYVSNLFPHFERWREEYGSIFTYSTGSMQQLQVGDVGVVKEMSLCTSLEFGKPLFLKKERKALFGHGVLTSNGERWVQQRKIIAPEFYMDKVKRMTNLMVDSVTSLLKSWEDKIECTTGGSRIGLIRIDEDLRNLSADVISRACFGSNYSQGEEIFSKLKALHLIMSVQGLQLGIPGSRYLPSKNNRKLWRLEKEVGSLISKVVKERKEAKTEQDLLQMILESANNGESAVGVAATDQFIIDNCKNIYFAGSETTAITSTWVMILLASYPEWQDRVRAEVEQVCKGCSPNVDMLRKMKTLTMVIQETVRLYPPTAFVVREATRDMTFGSLCVPKGVIVWIPILRMHHDPQIWGTDAHKFKPDRFAKGIAGACSSPQAYMSFGLGSRTCLGQNFAMAELKILVALIVSRFIFSLAPSYRHCPTYKLVIQPGDEVVLVVKKLSSS